MSARRVTCVRKEDDVITALGNSNSTWKEVSKATAIRQIEKYQKDEAGGVRYFVREDGNEVDIMVVDGETGKYLRTGPDGTSENNLLDLDPC